jgi:RAD3-like DEAD/DEAH box helicase
MAMFQLNETIRLYEPCNVLLCLICPAGIKPGDGAVSHFRKQHKLRGDALRQVTAFAASAAHASMFRAVETEGGRVVHECRRQATEEYVLRLKRFKAALLTAVHIWGGQPGRGPEMTTLKHCDTTELPRNVFVFDGLVVLITDHDKQRKGRRVARWLPADVSRMVVAYVAWLVPFEQVLHRLSGIRGPADTLQPWLWKDASKGLWDTADLSRRLDTLTSAHVGVRLTVASYRHVAIELGRQIKGLVVRLAEMDATGGGNECEEWTDPRTGEVREQPLADYIWDLQATHSSRIAASHYALSVLYPDQLQPEMPSNYRLVSELWHGFLRGGSEGRIEGKRGAAGWPDGPPSKRPRTDVGGPAGRAAGVAAGTAAGVAAGTAAAGRAARRTAEDVDAGLRRLFGPAAEWRSERQREIMVRIMGLQDNGYRSELLIVVLPTGGGKSVFFMLPAALDEDGADGGSTSIVVVPFAALLRDMERRARDAGIDCLWWRTGEHTDRTERQRDARLVLVSADVAVGAEFMAYAQSVRSRGRLARIFFDECHTSITDVGYRARLGRLGELHRFGCPMVMLTATLPVAMEGWYRERMLCRDAAMLRSAAAKLNIRYTVRTVAARKGGV